MTESSIWPFRHTSIYIHSRALCNFIFSVDTPSHASSFAKPVGIASNAKSTAPSLCVNVSLTCRILINVEGERRSAQ